MTRTARLTLSRRQLLVLGSTGLLATGLAACAGQSPQNTVTVVSAAFLAFVQAAAAELQGVQPLLAQAGPSVPGKVATGLADAISVLSSLNAASSQTTGLSALNTVITDLNAVAPVLVPIITAINPAVGAAVGLVVASLPAGEALLQVAISSFTAITTQTQQLAASAPKPAAARFGVASGPPTSNDYLVELLQRHPRG